MAQSSSEDPSTEGSKKHFTREELEDVTIESDDIPVRGSPEEFLTLVDELKGSGTRKIGDINDSIDDFGRTNLSGNVKYGVNLGFIERTADGIILTEEGVQLAYSQENEDELSSHFESGLQQEENYLSLLLEFEGDSDYQSQIKNSDVLQVMYTNHPLREEKDTVLKRATSILFETLELAGYGEVKEASGGLPIRFNFSEELDANSVIDNLVFDDTEEQKPSTEDEAEDTSIDEKTESPQNISDGDNIDKDKAKEPHINIEEIDKLEEGEILKASENGEDEQNTQEPEDRTGTKDIVIDIELKIDVNDMDSAELGEKIEHINKLIK